jgi:thiamine pyrophosphokinase
MPPEARKAIVLADGAAPDRVTLDAAWPGWDESVGLVVAADGGARHAGSLGLRVDRWVGDGDSIEPADLEALKAAGVAVDRTRVEKDESDAELALLAALEGGATEIVILGALGGPRIDHALANVGLLAHSALEGRPAVLFDERGARISLLVAPAPSHGAADTPVARELRGRVGDLVSLVPVGETALGVTTRGLRYPLAAESLIVGRTRGVSNVRTETVASVTLESGRLLVIETPATVRP